jgi:pantoate--beta-alanine ligase
MSAISRELKSKGKIIGFVPTMGALHHGHTSLFDKAKEHSEITIASIFVNPTQFGPNEDYSQYPRVFEQDAKLAKLHNVEYLFAPDALEMYPIGFSTSILTNNVAEKSSISDKFDGKLRPGHFNGVALVVAKLFNIVKPDFAIFGQKDFQQTLVVKQLVKDLNYDTKIVVAPTIRLENGLAVSSRNSYLSDEEKAKAAILYNSMELAKKAISGGERERKRINAIMHQNLRTLPEVRIDYASAVLASDLSEPDIFYPNDKIALLLAVYLGKTRLIDNSLISI